MRATTMAQGAGKQRRFPTGASFAQNGGTAWRCWWTVGQSSGTGTWQPAIDSAQSLMWSFTVGRIRAASYNSPMPSTPAVGEIASHFELLDSTGTRRSLSELTSQGPLVLLFYRGHW